MDVWQVRSSRASRVANCNCGYARLPARILTGRKRLSSGRSESSRTRPVQEAVIAINPNVISSELEIPPQVASFYGGTGLLIVISVALDLVQKINSHLVMRNYPSLTDE